MSCNSDSSSTVVLPPRVLYRVTHWTFLACEQRESVAYNIPQEVKVMHLQHNARFQPHMHVYLHT